jgi:hypothetical protein
MENNNKFKNLTYISYVYNFNINLHSVRTIIYFFKTKLLRNTYKGTVLIINKI